VLTRLLPGGAALVGAASVGVQDTATVRVPGHAAVLDSTVEHTLLPDVVTPIIRWIFQRPPWVMWGGAILAAVLAVVVLWWLRGSIKAMFHYLGTRSRAVKGALGAAVLLAVLGTVAAGMKSYDFVMNDKRFCNGCHVFVPSGQLAELPDGGSYTRVNQLEGKHDTLNCHTCHAFHAGKEAVKMVLWMSGVRDSTIPEHGKVPRDVCETCHKQGRAKKTWQAIAQTAGHRTHLESDSSALSGKVECLTCHARSAHRFAPVDSTCSQKGCHLTEDIRIKLGKMAGQTGMHCVACHMFTRLVPGLASFDSAKGSLVPGSQQCFSCHEMRQRMDVIDPARDPHGGTCGMCHNPHANVKPNDALKTCTNAACHADWRQVDFHLGAAHRKTAPHCETCHLPHAARVDASDCIGCHESVRERTAHERRGLRPPVPFDTLKALQRTSGPLDVEPRASHGKGDAPIVDPPSGAPSPSGVPSRPFSHKNHKKLTCIKCHDLKSQQSHLSFKAPRGCLLCHHEAPEQSDCATCHASARMDSLQFSETIHVQTTVLKAPERSRDVAFSHAPHSDVKCLECHTTTAATLAPSAKAAACQGCHDQHHDAGRDCAVCHRAETSWEAHTRESHVGCAACHQETTISRLSPDRKFCLGCHDPRVDHNTATECTLCHLLATPGAFRPLLMGAR
jgi:hypothetical protein